MSLTFKLLSLVIRTAAKPIGNYIKRQAKEHEAFRKFAVNRAQFVHRIDMRMRLGILHDADAQQRLHEREQKAADERKRKAEAPTVRTEVDQKQHEEDKAQGKDEITEAKKKKEDVGKVKIRPLSEAKAIELGANFFSEAFIFAVAAGLLVWDSWRSRKKESARRDDVAERLGELETEVERLRGKYEPQLLAITEKVRPYEKKYSWWNPAGWWMRTEPLDGGEIPVADEVGATKPIPGNVPMSQPEKAIKPTVPSSKPKEIKRQMTGKAPEAKAADTAQVELQAATGTRIQPSLSERVDSVPSVKKER
ncbi:hypothetical protein LTR86_004109 [Recurvomyces mirabilis]|nr:hypothetical protein LTR86_004109 [Recurvomyces mirabilis]